MSNNDRMVIGGLDVQGSIKVQNRLIMDGPIIIANMTTAQRLGLSPQTGMEVFDTDVGSLFIYETGTWMQVTTSATGSFVSTVNTGTGLTGGPITTVGTISLAPIAGVAGVYTNADITVDTEGRITVAGSGSSGSGGTVTNVATGAGLTGGPITTTGTIALQSGIPNTTGPIAYATVTVDTYGRVTTLAAGTPVTSVGVVSTNRLTTTGGQTPQLDLASGIPNTTLAVPYATVTADTYGRVLTLTAGAPVTNVATGTGLTGGPITTTGTISLANIAGVAGAYTNANITIDGQGRIIVAGDGTAGGGGTVTNVATGAGLTGGPITTTGTISLTSGINSTLTATGFATVTADTYGRVTALTAGSVTGTGGRITASAAPTVALDLASGINSTLTATAYATVTADTYGRVTSLTANTPVTSVATGAGLTGGPITTTGTISLQSGINSTLTATAYATVTADTYGRVTSLVAGTAPVTSVSGTASQIASTGGTTPVLSLINFGAGSGTHAYVSSVGGTLGNIVASGGTGAAFSVDAKGRILSATDGTDVTLNLASGINSTLTATAYATVTADTYGRVTSLVAGTAPVTSVSGTAGRITSTGGATPVLDLTSGINSTPNTPVAYATVTADTYGRVTALTAGTAPSGGTVTNVATGTGLTGGPITTTGTISLSPSGITLGTYDSGSSITFDTYGRATSTATYNSGITAATYNSGSSISFDHAGRAIASAPYLSGVTANGYTIPTGLVVNQAGVITSVTAGSITGTAGRITATAAPTIQLDLASGINSTLTATAYATVTADTYGRVTALTANTPVTSITAGAGLSGGTITSTGTISLTPQLPASITRTYATVTTDANGFITSLANGTAPVTSVGVTARLTTTGGTTPQLDLASGIPNTTGPIAYATVTVDTYGRVTTLTAGNPVTSVTASQQLTSSGGATPNITLDDTAVLLGTYNSSSYTVNQKGRLTAAYEQPNTLNNQKGIIRSGYSQSGHGGSIDSGSYLTISTLNMNAFLLDSIDTHLRGFGGICFDGRYVYMVGFFNGVPSLSGYVVRYDTSIENGFNTSSSYAFMNTAVNSGGLNTNSSGFYGCVFDGRYVYFVPSNNGQITRYDTRLSFTDANSYAVFNMAQSVPAQGLTTGCQGYRAAVVAGQYIYYIPYDTTLNPDSILVRFDTANAAGFTSTSSYSGVVLRQNAANLIATGPSQTSTFIGGTFDGRYLYLNNYGFGNAVRYDTTTSFTNGNNYFTCLMPAGFQASVHAYPYVYMIPSGSSVLYRYDTRLPFLASSLTTFDVSGVNANAGFWYGGCFDGRYLFLSPNVNTGGTVTGKYITIYDTAADFKSASSYQVFDMLTYIGSADGYAGCVYDGRYVYLAPNTRNDNSRNGTFVRFPAYSGTGRINPAPIPCFGNIYLSGNTVITSATATPAELINDGVVTPLAWGLDALSTNMTNATIYRLANADTSTKYRIFKANFCCNFQQTVSGPQDTTFELRINGASAGSRSLKATARTSGSAIYDNVSCQGLLKVNSGDYVSVFVSTAIAKTIQVLDASLTLETVATSNDA